MTLGLLGITAMLASCSQDEMLQSPTSGKNLVTVTATLPNGIQTRSDATQDEKSAIKRCVLAVYKTDGTFVKKMEDTTPENGFTFQFDADDTESQYNYYCWADDGESYTIDDNLTNITVSSELPTIAQRGEALEKALSDGDVTVPMSHAVAKISLKSTADFSNASVKVEANTHKAYDATTGKVKDGRTLVEKSVTDASVSGATSDTPQEVFVFYVLADADEANQTVTVGYNGAEEDVANVPIKADWCTTLQGNLTQVGLVSYTVRATIDSNWKDANAYYPEVASVDAGTHTITTKMGGEIAQNTTWITDALAGGNVLNICGLMNEDDFAAIKNYLKDNSGMTLNLNLAGVEMTTLPGNDWSTPESEWPGLESIVLPEGLITISQNAFRRCADLVSVTLPSTLETIGGSAFAYCTALTDVTFPASLRTLEVSAFYGCTELTKVDLSETQVGFISNYAFYGCTKVEEIKLGNNNKQIGDGTFSNCTALKRIDLSLCDQIPTAGFTPGQYSHTFADVTKTDIIVYVKNEDLKTEFGSSYWVTHEGFTTTNCQVKE